MSLNFFEDEHRNAYPNILMCMLNGSSLKTIVKNTGYSESYILEVLNSHEFDTYVIRTRKLNEIYCIPDEIKMEKALKLLALQLVNNHPSLNSRDCDRDGYFYIEGCWVKKDKRGRIVRRLKKTIAPPHAESEWFLKLRMKFIYIMWKNCV